MDNPGHVQMFGASTEELRAEIVALRERVAELEGRGGDTYRPIDLSAMLLAEPATFRATPEGLVTEWSCGAERLLGWTQQDIVGHSFLDVLSPPEVPDEHRRVGLDAINHGHLQASRALTTVKGSVPVPCRWTYTVMRDASGTATEIFSELEREHTELRPEETLAHSRHVLLSVVNHAPGAIYVKDMQSRYVMMNRSALRMLGKTLEEVLGRTDEDFFASHVAAHARVQDQRALDERRAVEFEYSVSLPEGTRHIFVTKFPLFDTRGEPIGVCGIGTDITDRKQAEAERLQMQQRMIDAQRAALREMAMPLVPIANGVLAMPLVGAIDSLRAAEIMETLLRGIERYRAHSVILDITGVRMLDTQVATALVSAARAAQLLGAEVLLTGISPSVAQTLVGMGIELSDMITLATLQHGIAYALRNQRLAAAASPRRLGSAPDRAPLESSRPPV
ncbi:PAS domain-containing protein [Chondromyces crocatus]|uniref:Anti-anti-sigma factor n=1 Tax=Chondromyces crocatus TaxID=52 RepID=A0A0K1EEA5_CHOCO|nr:PAS domain-containing protein [Chondromyces crocatus]AKT38913.1 anti-anti-sigma factor [Chondromyces crocatus]